jgi:hypothetical protein
MDPVTLVEWLAKLGPWAVAGILAFWLKLERAERVAAQADANAQRDQRTTEMQDRTEALAALGEATRKAIDGLTRAVGKEGT